MSEGSSLVNFYRVKVFSKNELMLEKTVKSKAPRNAVTNVLTNIYKGEVDKVEITQTTFFEKKEEETMIVK